MMEVIGQAEVNTKELKSTLRNAEISINLKPNTLDTAKVEEQQKNLAEWKNTAKKGHIHIPEFEIPKKLLNVLIKGNDYKGLVLLGEGGVGKTCMTIQSIKSNLKPGAWEYQNGYTTPLALYEFLYKGRDKDVLILDDIEGVFNNQVSLSILKAALWDVDGQRIVHYNSSSKHLEAPRAFVIRAKVIILCNSIPKAKDLSMRAMLSRTISYEFNLSYKQKLKICEQFINNDDDTTNDQKNEVIQLLKSHTNRATKDFNFRTMRKAIAFVKNNPDSAEELFKATTKEDELKAAYFQTLDSKTVKEQVKKFQDLTGKSRRTFFNIKKLISAEVRRETDVTLAQLTTEE